MSVGTVIFVLGLMSPSVICLYYAWKAWDKLGTTPTKNGWRAQILIAGVMLASFSQLLVTAFLLAGFRSDGQSFATRVSLPWAIANWTSLLSWLLSLAAVVLGKGSIRRSLLVWCFLMPMASWIIFMMGYDY
jgi:hypothetical protein